MKAIEINWSLDEKAEIEHIVEAGYDMERMAGVKGYPAMSDDEKKEALCDFFRHRPGVLEEFLELPPEADFPEDLSEKNVEEYGWEWLEDTYGSIIEGFKIKFDDGRIVEKGVIAGVPYIAN